MSKVDLELLFKNFNFFVYENFVSKEDGVVLIL